LVESVHTPKGPRQNTICSLGDLSPRPRREWLKLACKIEDALLDLSDQKERSCSAVDEIARQHLVEVERKIADLTSLRRELKG